jgi:hypothetical protein
MLGLDGRRAANAGLLLRGAHDDAPSVLTEGLEHHDLPAASRFACFLWTAWLVTPSASATCAHVQPSRSARSMSTKVARAATGGPHRSDTRDMGVGQALA